MRRMLIEFTLVVALAAAVFFVNQPASRLGMRVYPLIREAAAAKMDYQTRNLSVAETPHFTIKYAEQDADTVAIVAQAAEAAYQPVTQGLGYTPGGKTIIVINQSRQELNRAFGWSGDQSAMGVYWGGVIQVLSPRVWLRDTSAESFIRSGPMVHEYTHLVLDHLTRGNYPRWFTEGLAQYEEYKVNGYEWRTANNSLQGQLYPMTALDENFDGLTNQALAYRESLAAVRYIAAVHGEDKLRQLISFLAAGCSMEDAVAAALGMDYSEFAAAWPHWARANM
jgi:hypothetical protein